MSIMSSSEYDFDFQKDGSKKFIPFIIGFLMYSATISIMSCFFTSNITNDWKNALNGRITIEFQSNIDGADEPLTENQRNEICEVVKSTPGIKSIKQLKETEILKILDPWLSGTSIPDDFPFPTIFDVETDDKVIPDLLSLSDKLGKISQGAKIHDHSHWYSPVLKVSVGLFAFSALLSVLIFLTVCATIMFITKQTLKVHESIVGILQLIGAHNKYIATQFRKYYFMIGCIASVIAFVLGVITIVCINYASSSQAFGMHLVKYIAIAATVPVVTIILMMITAQKSVMFFLHKDKWIN